MRRLFDVGDLWDMDFLWDTFAFLLKIAAPFLLIIIAILAVGALLVMIVTAVVTAVKNR